MEQGINKKIIYFVVIIFLIAGSGLAFVYFFTFQQDSYKNIAENKNKNFDSSANNFTQLYGLGEIDASINQALEIVSKDEDDFFGYIALANAYVQKAADLGNERDYINLAYQAINKALELKPDNSDAVRIIGYVYDLRGESDKSLEMYNRALELDPSNDLNYEARGNFYQIKGLYDLAEIDYKRALEINRENSRVLSQLASVYIVTGQDEDIDVEEIFEQAIKFERNSRELSKTYNAYGSYKMVNIEYGEAAELFEKANEAFPDQIDVLGNIGLAYIFWAVRDQTENPEGFETRLDTAASIWITLDEIDSNYPVNNLIFGLLLDVLGETEESREMFDSGLIKLNNYRGMTTQRKEHLLSLFNIALNNQN